MKSFFLTFLVISITILFISCETIPIIVIDTPAAGKGQEPELSQPEIITPQPRLQEQELPVVKDHSMPLPELGEQDWFRILAGDVKPGEGEKSLSTPLLLQPESGAHEMLSPALPEEEIPASLLPEEAESDGNNSKETRGPEIPVPLPELEEIKQDLADVKRELKSVKTEKQSVSSTRDAAPVKTVNKANTSTTKKSAAPVKDVSPSQIEEFLARPGDEIEIRLPDSGWIFPGFLNSDDILGLAFLSRDPGVNETRFLFQARQTGEYTLSFLLQDNAAGTAMETQYLVRVVAEDQFYSLLPKQEDTTVADLSTADALHDQGKYVQALSEYLKNYNDSSAYLNDRIAVIYERLGDYDAAARYWQRNSTAEAPYDRQAAAGLVRVAVQQDDLDTILANLDSVSGTQAGAELINVAAYLADQAKPGISIRLLDDFLARAGSPEYLDDVYYLLARLYEQDNPYRDFKKSREYYTTVYTEFPDSDYAQASTERVRYLNRHFFYFW